MLQPGQYSDLELIAEGRGVPTGTAAYAMITEFLSGRRQRALDPGLRSQSLGISPHRGGSGNARGAASPVMIESGRLVRDSVYRLNLFTTSRPLRVSSNDCHYTQSSMRCALAMSYA